MLLGSFHNITASTIGASSKCWSRLRTENCFLRTAVSSHRYWVSSLRSQLVVLSSLRRLDTLPLVTTFHPIPYPECNGPLSSRYGEHRSTFPILDAAEFPVRNCATCSLRLRDSESTSWWDRWNNFSRQSTSQ